MSLLLLPTTKLGQGNIFTGICDSIHREGVCLGACWDTKPSLLGPDRHPPGLGRHPQDQAGTPQDQAGTPRTRQAPPQDQAGTPHPTLSDQAPPQTGRHPSWDQDGTPLPGAEHTGRYSQRAGGMHPTGMQSCINFIMFDVTFLMLATVYSLNSFSYKYHTLGL